MIKTNIAIILLYYYTCFYAIFIAVKWTFLQRSPVYYILIILKGVLHLLCRHVWWSLHCWVNCSQSFTTSSFCSLVIRWKDWERWAYWSSSSNHRVSVSCFKVCWGITAIIWICKMSCRLKDPLNLFVLDRRNCKNCKKQTTHCFDCFKSILSKKPNPISVRYLLNISAKRCLPVVVFLGAAGQRWWVHLW